MMTSYKVLHRKFEREGIYCKRTTTEQRWGKVSRITGLALAELDISVMRMKPDYGCALCREGIAHSVDLHDEMIEAYWAIRESEGQVKQV